MSRFDYFETIDGPQSRVDATGRLIPAKGGGGGNAYYANQDKLFGTQADIAQNLYNQYADLAPGYLGNTKSMVDEANSGALGARARATAGADSSNAFGAAMGAVNRDNARYGDELNSSRKNAMANSAALDGAVNKAGAMNNASQWAEDQKWNRNAGAYGQISGMSTGAMQGMGSAAAGYGSMANSIASQNNLGMQGFGRLGAAIGGSAFADGGAVQKPGLHLANGGSAQFNNRLNHVDWQSQPTGDYGNDNSGYAASLGTGMAMAAGAKLAGEGLKAAGNYAIDAGKAAYGKYFPSDTSFVSSNAATPEVASAYPVADTTVGVAQTSLPATSVATGASEAAGAGAGAGAGAATTGAGAATTGAAGTIGAEAAGTIGAEAAGTIGAEAAGTAASEAAATAAAETLAAETAAGTTAATNFWNPIGWAAGAYGLGKALDWWADGGPVPHDGDPRKDFTPGGKVSGPGTETSDDIPAWLSDGEYVLNAEAVKIIGRDKLDALNHHGLMLRRGKPEEAAEGTPNVKDSPAEERKEARGLKTKKLACGGPVKRGGKGLKLAKGGHVKKGC